MPEIEIITDGGRRRRWTASEKLRIVEETLDGRSSISVVARRHGVAPNLLYRWRRLMLEGGSVAVVAGRILDLDSDGTSLLLRYRRRGHANSETAHFAHAINCVGPGGDIARTQDPLLRCLLDQGLPVPDPLRLGLDTDGAGRLRSADGNTVQGLYAVGPIMKGTSWEITAVPDIRQQAKLLASTIAEEVCAR